MSKDGVKITAILLSVVFVMMLIFWLIQLNQYFNMKNPVGAVGPNYESNLERAKNWLIYQAWSTLLLGAVNIFTLTKAYRKAATDEK